MAGRQKDFVRSLTARENALWSVAWIMGAVSVVISSWTFIILTSVLLVWWCYLRFLAK